MSKVNGIVVYEGPSALDGAPIAVIVVGMASGSKNTKTGAMLQSYIVRTDMLPTEAIRRGLDVSICGDCVHRSKASDGRGTCYVNVGQGPRAVVDAYWRGRYRVVSVETGARMIAALHVGFRIGSYGDPGAVPDAGRFWRVLSSGATFRTGYTHRASDTGSDLRGLVMASADSASEASALQALGWTTFRVVPVGYTERMRGEAICPASAEAGKRVTCSTCPMACDGIARPGNVGRVIQAHGASKNGVTL